MRFHLWSWLLLFGFVGLASAQHPDPQTLVDQARAAHGSAVLDHAIVTFDFRGRHFTVMRDGGVFRYERAYEENGDRIREGLDNDGVWREVNGRRLPLSDEERLAIEGAINSVVYFALLPYFLNDAAVQKRYLGTASVEGEPYHEVEVTFRQEGGGRDWEDRFVYWLHRDRHTMDYLAYTFHVNGGGTRFREAFNVRTVSGVRFADYKNYTAESIGMEIDRYAASPDDLTLLSEVILENVSVQPLEQ